jgi:ribosomal protein S27AE
METAAWTQTEYQGFQRAYDFFNRELFAGSLPQVLVTLQRHARTYGYFSPERFSGRIAKTTAHELALNPDGFAGRKEVGLQPSSTGEEGGAETGQSVSHYILPGGRYAIAYAKLAATGFQFHWQSVPASEGGKGKKSSKTKFTCPACGQNAWAKPGARLICGECYDDGEGEITLMLAEQ